MGLWRKFRHKIAEKDAAAASAGVCFGISSAYVTEVKGENVERRTVAPGEVAKRTRRCRTVVGALGGPAVAYKNAVVPPDLGGRELDEAVRWQFYELDSASYRFVYRKADFAPEGNASYVCAAVPPKLLEEFCAAHSGAFTSLDLRPFALWRGFKLARPESSPCLVVASWPDGVTVVGGRTGVEFVREIPPTANTESEVVRTVDYYRRAFDAAEAEVVELNGEEAARAVADGCAFAPRDPAFTDILPEEHRRIRPTELRKPKAGEAAAAFCLAAALVSAAPHAAAWHYRNMEQDLRAGILRNAPAAAEAQRLSSEAAKYREWINAVETHRVVPYSTVLADLRAAVPPGMVLDTVEIGTGEEQPAQPRAGAPGAASRPGGGITQRPGSSSGQGSSAPGTGNQDAASGTAQTRPAQKAPAEQPGARTQPLALYTPDLLRVQGKARDLAEVGLLADNLAQLPYVSGVAVQEASYENHLYRFRLEAELKWP